MKKICDFCEHQVRMPGRYYAVCNLSHLHTDSEGHGTFKHGSVCVHDEDLKDLFEVRSESSVSVQNMVDIAARQDKKMSELRDENRILKHRLTNGEKE